MRQRLWQVRQAGLHAWHAGLRLSLDAAQSVRRANDVQSVQLLRVELVRVWPSVVPVPHRRLVSGGLGLLWQQLRAGRVSGRSARLRLQCWRVCGRLDVSQQRLLGARSLVPRRHAHVPVSSRLD